LEHDPSQSEHIRREQQRMAAKGTRIKQYIARQNVIATTLSKLLMSTHGGAYSNNNLLECGKQRLDRRSILGDHVDVAHFALVLCR
jgi:hypothetical protein